jgi:hypothetical protein
MNLLTYLRRNRRRSGGAERKRRRERREKREKREKEKENRGAERGGRSHYTLAWCFYHSHTHLQHSTTTRLATVA